MKVCITGASGFLGLWTAQVFSKDSDVFAVTRVESSIGRLVANQKITLITEPIENWASSINKIGPDALIMHDWQGVANSGRNSVAQYSNVERVKELVTALQPIEKVIGVGSQAELGPREDEIQEDDPSRPTSDYGRAKSEVRDFLIDHFHGSSTNFKWARIFSTYGALDNGDWLIPNLVKSLNLEKPFLLTAGTQEWNYLHAFDAAEAFRVLSISGDAGIYNIGNTKNDLIRDVCTVIATIMGKDHHLLKFGDIPMRSDQVYKLWVSTSKLQALGWRPKVDLTQGLIHTISWLCQEKVAPIQLNDGTQVELSKLLQGKNFSQLS